MAQVERTRALSQDFGRVTHVTTRVTVHAVIGNCAPPCVWVKFQVSGHRLAVLLDGEMLAVSCLHEPTRYFQCRVHTHFTLVNRILALDTCLSKHALIRSNNLAQASRRLDLQYQQ